jgi:c-di-GMP phosphodiesterase
VTGVLGELLLARQPVLDAGLQVVAYEVLHRPVAVAPGTHPRSAATSLVVDSLLAVGRQELTGGADLWVEVPTELLRSQALVDLPSDGITLGVPVDAVPDAALRRALEAHRAAGYGLVLDGVSGADPRLELLDVVDHVRVPLAGAGHDGTLPLIGELVARGTSVVATSIGSVRQFERAVAIGADRFQGSFWIGPSELRPRRALRFAPGHLELLTALSQAEVDLRAVEALIRSDITLTDRFLRLIRRVVGYRRVASIHDGLVLLGVRAVQRWVSLLTLGRLADDAPAELVTLASARARGCELLEELRGGSRRLEAFTVGMFSVLGDDGRLTREVLDALPLSGDVRAALEDGSGPLRILLDLELATERAAWSLAERTGWSVGITPEQLARAQAAALSWSAAACA